MASDPDPTAIPAGLSSAVLRRSGPISEGAVSVQGPNFEAPLSLVDFLHSYERIGFQANSLGRAIDIVNRMVGSVAYSPLHYRTRWVITAKMASVRRASN